MRKIKKPEGAGTGMSLNVANKIQKPGTNILEFVVPPELDRTVSTGMSWMNDSFGGDGEGGLTPSSVILLTGLPGAGKTTLASQLADSMTGTGESIVLYSGTEEAVVQLRKTSRRLGHENGFIVDDNPLIDNSPGSKDQRFTVLDHARLLHERNPNKQLVVIIDSIQSHDDGYYTSGHTNRQSQVRVAERLADYCKSPESGYAIGILVGQVNKAGDFAGPQALKHVIDVHAHLDIDMAKKSPTRGKRLFNIQKNRFGVSGMIHLVTMTSKGLVEEGLLADLFPDEE